MQGARGRGIHQLVSLHSCGALLGLLLQAAGSPPSPEAPSYLTPSTSHRYHILPVPCCQDHTTGTIHHLYYTPSVPHSTGITRHQYHISPVQYSTSTTHHAYHPPPEPRHHHHNTGTSHHQYHTPPVLNTTGTPLHQYHTPPIPHTTGTTHHLYHPTTTHPPHH